MSASYAPLRWTKAMVNFELQIDEKTFTKKATELSVEAGQDGKFSTAQVVEVVFGNIQSEKLKKMKAERILAEIKAAEAEGSLVLKTDFLAVVADLGTKVRLLIEGSKVVTPAARVHLLKELQKIKQQ